MNRPLNDLRARFHLTVRVGLAPFVLATTSLGCAITTPPWSRGAPAPTAPPPIERAAGSHSQWSDLSSEARAAMGRGHFGEAEAIWLRALAKLEHTPPSDARVRATLSNLVRLASVYQRLERRAEADRVISIVETHVSAEGRESLHSEDYVARYLRLTEQALDGIYRLQPAFADQRRDFEPTVAALIRRTARKYQVDPDLVKAVVAVESNFDILAVSEKGAQGLMQLMPATAREMGVRSPFKPSENIRGGVRYLRTLLDRYPDLEIALAAYNAGPVAVDRHGGIPPYPETEAYVKRVLQFYREYRDE